MQLGSRLDSRVVQHGFTWLFKVFTVKTPSFFPLVVYFLRPLWVSNLICSSFLLSLPLCSFLTFLSFFFHWYNKINKKLMIKTSRVFPERFDCTKIKENETFKHDESKEIAILNIFVLFYYNKLLNLTLLMRCRCFDHVSLRVFTLL